METLQSSSKMSKLILNQNGLTSQKYDEIPKDPEKYIVEKLGIEQAG